MFATLLHKVSLGSPSMFRNLTLTPILLKDGPLSPIETISLEEALAAGHLLVTEVSAEGHVPELRVKNSGDAPVLTAIKMELLGKCSSNNQHTCRRCIFLFRGYLSRMIISYATENQ